MRMKRLALALTLGCLLATALISPALADPIIIEFTDTGTHEWTAPTYVNSIDLVVVGGGGGGSGGRNDPTYAYAGLGGNAGSIVLREGELITPGSTITIVIGEGGTGGGIGGNGGTGGGSAFGSIAASGGSGGIGQTRSTLAGGPGQDGYGSGLYAVNGTTKYPPAVGGLAGIGRGAGGGGGADARTGGAGAPGYVLIAYPPPPPPSASFTASPLNGNYPLTVQFTDTSTGTPTSWAWDFGDGTSSSDQHPTHTYLNKGLYTVTLVATNEYGNGTVTKMEFIACGIAYPPCDGLTISAANITAQSVTLSGTTPYPEVWIVLGAAPGKYGYQSSIISTNTSDYSATIVSLPLIAGQTYYARAGTAGGYSPEISFSLPALTPAPVTTHGDIFSTLMAGNLSIGDVWTAEADLYARPFGGGDFGLAAFISLISAFVFVILFLRSGDVIVPFTVAALVGGMLIPYLLPQFAEIGYAFMVAAMIGIGYSLYRRYL